MGKFFLKFFFYPSCVCSNDQLAMGIILRHVCQGTRHWRQLRQVSTLY